jgi:hypothetical protein
VPVKGKTMKKIIGLVIAFPLSGCASLDAPLEWAAYSNQKGTSSKGYKYKKDAYGPGVYTED